jgi:GNAT superfamily N-acetyltransferase
MNEQVEIRPFNPETDTAFVCDSWMKYFCQEGLLAQDVPKATFYKWHRKIVDLLLAREDVTKLVAEQNGTILGYVVSSPAAMHWCYVKFPFRGHGVATALLAAAKVDLDKMIYTHRTKTMRKSSFDRKHPAAVYNPYLLGA